MLHLINKNLFPLIITEEVCCPHKSGMVAGLLSQYLRVTLDRNVPIFAYLDRELMIGQPDAEINANVHIAEHKKRQQLLGEDADDILGPIHGNQEGEAKEKSATNRMKKKKGFSKISASIIIIVLVIIVLVIVKILKDKFNRNRELNRLKLP